MASKCPHPFRIGDRVRRNPNILPAPYYAGNTGTVEAIIDHPQGHNIGVHWDGMVTTFCYPAYSLLLLKQEQL